MLKKNPQQGHGQAVRKGFEANLYTKQQPPSFKKLEFTKMKSPNYIKNAKITAFRSLGGRLAHVRFAPERFRLESFVKGVVIRVFTSARLGAIPGVP